MDIYRLENVIQPYSWGSKTAIADLFGRPSPAKQPEAELWMGTHPKGPSTVIGYKSKILLQDLINRHPVDILGHNVALRYGNALPYLFKVLAAAQPLSIQAHPSKRQAITGFLRENRQAKALDAPDRSYRDDNHKPEIICALAPFWVLSGFRPATEAAKLLAPVCPHDFNDALQILKRNQKLGLRKFFEAMLTLPAVKQQSVASEIIDKAKPLAEASSVYRWMVDLARVYPADMGILSPALMNLVCLEPGQAMYLPAGQLHTYLNGVGIELMANSDNVLRGGLTSKHVDVPELLNVVHFEETPINILVPEQIGPVESRYECPVADFSLSIIRPTQRQRHVAPPDRNVEILLCTAGEGCIETGSQGRSLTLKKGDSLVVPAGLDSYVIHGEITIYKAAVL